MSDNTVSFGDKANQIKKLIEELCLSTPQPGGESHCKAVDSGQKILEDVGNKACQAAKMAASTVRKYPVETAVIAVGIGALTWWLLTRKE